MTPEDFREARRKLGLSAQEMALALGVADGRTVRRWEAGDRDIPGPAIALIRIWLDDRCPDWAKPDPDGATTLETELTGVVGSHDGHTFTLIRDQRPTVYVHQPGPHDPYPAPGTAVTVYGQWAAKNGAGQWFTAREITATAG